MQAELPVAEDLLKNAENFALAVGYLLSTSVVNETRKSIKRQNFGTYVTTYI